MVYENPLMSWFREEAAIFTNPLARRLHKLGVKPNLITTLSFLSGLAAVYFLFYNHAIFVFFGVLHLLFDGLDGSLARVSQTSSLFGKWYDYATDRTITFLLLAKCALVYETVFWILLAYFCHHLIYVLCKGEIIVFYGRTILLVSLILGYDWFGLYAVGVIGMVGISAQVLSLIHPFLKAKI
ncbi:CDP-alcohol phosphatidyltransferase family protein [Candidatus Woesearchaeota archaeon]|nr:CDP-alcohol phosphatidyltransferase family protein [Candidatus Woesearchaeota archaeon]